MLTIRSQTLSIGRLTSHSALCSRILRYLSTSTYMMNGNAPHAFAVVMTLIKRFSKKKKKLNQNCQRSWMSPEGNASTR